MRFLKCQQLYFNRFKEYLVQDVKIKEEIIQYYLKRVKDVLRYHNKKMGDEISYIEKNKYLVFSSNTLEEWQIKQADYAIKLYPIIYHLNIYKNS